MFGTWFYHKRIRTAVATFGSLFNNIYVLRMDSNDKVISTVKCPLSYSPKRNFLARLNNMAYGEEAERSVAIKLPRMSFEITNLGYNPERVLPKTNNSIQQLETNSVNKRRRLYTGVPYTISFQLNIYAKSQDDALQIVEQILPYFTPQYSLTLKPFSDLDDFKEDVPVILRSAAFSDDYEAPLEQRRTIIYTLDFDMNISFYGPKQEGTIIRKVNANIFNMEAGLDDSDVFVERVQVVPDPLGVSPDSDYGFSTYYLDSAAE